MIRRAFVCGVALCGLVLGPASASPLGHEARGSGGVSLMLKPCCSTLPVRPGAPPPHYGPRVAELRDKSGAVVVRKKVPMSRWTNLSAPAGRYQLTAQGCDSTSVTVHHHGWSRRTLICPVP